MAGGAGVRTGSRSPGRVPVILLALIFTVSGPALADTVLFIASSNQISSLGVLDIAEDPHGTLYFGTDNGLSIYDGSWQIRHMTYGNVSYGLLSDHILAIEFDREGRLWLGYPDGIQVIEDGLYETNRDQQLLKSLDIHGLLLANGRMWVAAGTAGLHRYRDGTWEWFQPGGREGLGCNYVDSMTADNGGKTLYVSCNSGIWSTENSDSPVSFTPFTDSQLATGSAYEIKEDPFGGVYIFNSSAILHYNPQDSNPQARLRLIATPADLMMGIDIADVQVDPSGALWIATNYGLYKWDIGVKDHIDASRGIRNNAVKKLYLDSQDRLWFVTPENVGYYQLPPESWAGNPTIPVDTFPVVTTYPAPPAPPAPSITPAVSYTEVQEAPAAPVSPLDAFLNAISGFFSRLLGR